MENFKIEAVATGAGISSLLELALMQVTSSGFTHARVVTRSQYDDAAQAIAQVPTLELYAAPEGAVLNDKLVPLDKAHSHAEAQDFALNWLASQKYGKQPFISGKHSAQRGWNVQCQTVRLARGAPMLMAQVQPAWHIV